MNLYKLKYPSQVEAEKALKSMGIIEEFELGLKNANGVHAVVYIGLIVDKPAVMIDGKITTEATFLDGYHVDIATDNEYKFVEGVEQNPANPKHLFWL